MRVIRPIREGEANDFLRLICRSFGLDYSGAQALFFSEPYFDLNRKWALFEGDDMLSALTTTPMDFGWGRAIGIAGVCTEATERSRGLGASLLREVLIHAERSGEGPAMLFARDERLYHSVGFVTCDATVRAELVTSGEESTVESMPFERVREIYDAWAASDPARLRRDEKRWLNWKWNYRVCEPLDEGYIATEPGYLREAVPSRPRDQLDLPSDSSWIGLGSLVHELGLPVKSIQADMHVMTRGFPLPPRMFMTDQF